MDNSISESERAQAFYKKALLLLKACNAKFMIGGAFAVFHYTGIYRDTKDLDIFCEAEEYPKILEFFREKGYRPELTDIRWLAKVYDGDYYLDIIFDTPNNVCKVDDQWFRYAVDASIFGVEILIIPPEELIWCKTYVQNRNRHDGADIQHVILKYGEKLEWKRLLSLLNQHWHLLLANLILFQFIYPADYQNIIPIWLINELLDRAHRQYNLPPTQRKVCLGPLIDQEQYQIDITKWDYKVTML